VLSIDDAEHDERFWDRFRSRPRKLAKWLFESRQNWKKKYGELKVLLKRLQVQLADVRKSREQWKERAQYSSKELDRMRAQVEQLRQLVQQSEEEEAFKKKK
jgi:hypothetical protein